jgi:serine/threonine protein phosphatase PrpC
VASPGWRVAAARRRGEAHARRGERCQDAVALALVGPGGGTLLAAVADGAGSARRGGAGAALAARAAVAAAQAARGGGGRLTEAGLGGWMRAARARLMAAAEARGVAARDCASTLLLLASDGRSTVVGHVGDGAAAARAPADWTALSWPDAGEHAGETRFLTDPDPAIRVARHATPVAAVALLTDGLERLVLDFAGRVPHAPFFDRMTAPLAALPAPGRDRALSAALAGWLGGAAVAARTDDDRALLLAVLA